ncbi:MAG: HEPN domain-containing protein [Candidatus Bathyarchaeia archaeon]
MLDEEEYRRWMRASEGALRSAMGDLEREDHNWACFKAHQSGEFERLMAKRDPLAVEALESGAILRDDLKLFEAGGLRG